MQVYNIQFPRAIPVTTGLSLMEAERSWVARDLLMPLESARGVEVGKIIRKFTLKSSDKLDPKLVGVKDLRDIFLLPIDSKAEEMKVEWYEEDAYLISPASPPKDLLPGGKANGIPIEFDEYKRQLAPWLFNDFGSIQLEASSMYIKIPDRYKDAPGKYAGFVELVWPPMGVEGDNFILPLFSFLELTRTPEIWTMIWFRPLKSQEFQQMRQSWKKVAEIQMKRKKNVDEDALKRTEMLMEIIEGGSRDDYEKFATLKVYFMIFGKTITEVQDKQNLMMDLFEGAGWKTNPGYTGAQALLDAFFPPNLKEPWDMGSMIMTSSMIAASGLVHGTTFQLGNMFVGNTLTMKGEPMSVFSFDPFEAGIKNIAGVSNYIVTITGAQGSGKSFFGKLLMMDMKRKYGKKLKIRIIDVTGEYTLSSMSQGGAPFIYAIGGDVALITPGGLVNLNPLEIKEADWKRGLQYEKYVDSLTEEEKERERHKEDKEYTRTDLVSTEISKIWEWLMIAFSDDFAGNSAQLYMGAIGEMLWKMFLYGRPIGHTRKMGQAAPEWKFLLRDKMYDKFYPLALKYAQEQISKNDVLAHADEETYDFVEELLDELRELYDTRKSFVTSMTNNQLAVWFKKYFFRYPRYRFPMLQDVYEMINVLIDEYGWHHYEPLRTELAKFTRGSMSTIMRGRKTTLPDIEHHALSIHVDREAFPEKEQILIYTLLLNEVLKDMINYQIKNADNKAYFLIAMDEMWKLLQGSEYVKEHIMHVLARDTRKYLIGGLYMSQSRQDFFYPSSPFRTSAMMRFFGRGESWSPGDAIPAALKTAYEEVAAKEGTHAFLFVVGGDDGTKASLVRAVAAPHEIGFAEVISQGRKEEE